MVLLKKEYEEMINEVIKPEEEKSTILRLISVSPVKIFAGIEPKSLEKIFIILLGKDPLNRDQINILPQWKGLSLKFEYRDKIGPYSNQFYIILKQEVDQDEEIFQFILQNIFETLQLKENEESLYVLLFKTLEKWKTFFSRGGFKKLNEEQQQGLFGEVYFIKKCIEYDPNHLPIIINNWEGPLSNKIDFLHSNSAIEIKTTKLKINKSVKISSEHQLMLNKSINRILLYVCFIEKSKSFGYTLDEMINYVREQIGPISQDLLLQFNEYLIQVGYRDGEYDSILYEVNSVELYEVKEGFPRITPETFNSVISNVSYNINLKACEQYLLEEEVAYRITDI